MSFLIPSSSDRTSRTCPGVSSLIFLDVMIIGIGQKYPSVSSVTSDRIIHHSLQNSAVLPHELLAAPRASGLYEQIHAALLSLGEVGRDACKLVNPIDEGFLADAHQTHGGRAGDKANAQLLSRLYQLRNARHSILLHDPLHHRGPEPTEI